MCGMEHGQITALWIDPNAGALSMAHLPCQDIDEEGQVVNSIKVEVKADKKGRLAKAVSPSSPR